MKLQKIAFFMLFALCLSVSAQNRQAALAEVAAAENSFADRAAAAGTKTAFVEYAAEDGLVFSDRPQNARAVWQKRPASESLLAWRPNWVDVSAAGDLGLSTGSWSLSPSKTAAPTAWGEFFSIWKKQPDGSWRFLLDTGISHGKSEVVRDN